MDRVERWGRRSMRREVFTSDLVADAEDHELQHIVERAASELNAPIALVTLVLDQVQFFKAHYGLPPELAASRASRRDASFCQFVVRDEQPLEVHDAARDSKLPQQLVEEYGIAAYLGFPIRVQDTVIGSLCVLDTEPRPFTEEHRRQLAHLAERVDNRLAELTERRRQTRFALTEQAAGPALAELAMSLASVHDGVRASLVTIPALRAFTGLARRFLDGADVSPQVLKATLEAAAEAIDAAENALYDIEAAAGDGQDCLSALDGLMTPGAPTRLSTVMSAAQDLARPRTRAVGGAPLPDLAFDPVMYTPRSLAVAVLTGCLTSVADAMARVGGTGGIRLRPEDDGRAMALKISADALSTGMAEELAVTLAEHLGDDPTLAVTRAGDALRVSFHVHRDGDATRPPDLEQ